MNWFAGNIAEAVNLSKTRNAIFVVFCEGTDDQSKALKSVIDDSRIRKYLESDKFVAIKVESNSEAYVQFTQIYQLVPLPSIFFIGKNGTPVDVVTGVTQTVDELIGKIEIVLDRAGLKSAGASGSSTAASAASANLLANEKSGESDEFEVVCKDGVCFKQPKQKKQETNGSGDNAAEVATSSGTEVSSEERLKRARDLIEKKRQEKDEENARLERERELQRRRVGQDLANFKQRQEETDMKKLQEERKRDKIEEREIRKRILEQIAQDKAERAQRFNNVAPNQPTESASTSNKIPPQPPLVSDSSSARLQFKKPGGDIDIQTFPSTEQFTTVRTYVQQNIIAGTNIKEFALATTFPKKEFKDEDNSKTLLELGLVPSSVILILPLDKAPSNSLPLQPSFSVVSMLSMIVWGVVNPILGAFNYVKGWIFSQNQEATGAAKRASEEELTPNDKAKRRVLNLNNPEPEVKPETSGAYRRVGGSNIHRLQDNRDSDDENNTWNGNSTQQQ